jgi:cytochrome oxidase Cu insertion factor (SCO1/SenC/PrrC family)
MTRACLLACALAWFAPVACAQSARQETPRDEPRVGTPRDEPRAQAARLMNELMSGKAVIGAPFTLTNPQGKRVSLADFRGKIVLLYFGYASCPDVCPTDLLAIAQTIKSLGKAGEQVQPLFITLDPARDTPEVLRGYAAAFHPRLIALTGGEDEIRRVATAYKVFYEKVRIERADLYLIDHAAFTFLLDRSGKYVLFFPPGTSSERMAVMVREQLAKK